MRWSLVTIIFFVCFSGVTQNLVLDSSFQRLGEFYTISGLNLQWHPGVFSKGEIHSEKVDDRKVAAFKFRVNSVQVDPNFIIAQLTEELKAGETYTVDLKVKKDKFSPFSIQAIQVYFAASFNQSTAFVHGAAAEQFVSFDLSEVSNDSFLKISLNYEAQGGEEFIYLGSIAQRFSIGESTRLGLLMADRTYNELPHNCTYYVSEVSVKKADISAQKVTENFADNWYNLKAEGSNLVVNGGAEASLQKRYFSNDFTQGSSGSLIAPFVYALTSHCPEVNQLDSNEYRSQYDVNQLCYMGDGQFVLNALKTNLYHTYQEVIRKDEGQDYDTYHVYEKAPYQDVKPYAFGEYLVFALREPLQRGKEYHWSSMIKMSEAGSYGVPHLGVHFVDGFPQNITDSLWQRYPEEVIAVSHLAGTQAWSDFNLTYQAKGGERFMVIGHLPSPDGVIKNKKFVPQFFSDCGPHSGTCSSRFVYYKDSLFARYQLDNIALVEGEAGKGLSIGYPPGKRVQLEIVFNEIEKSDWAEANLEKVKVALINAQQVLRVEDAICIIDQRKKDPLILDPNPIINKKKILRKIDKPKPVKKIKIPNLPPESILFGEGQDEVNINHLVLVADAQFSISQAEEKLAGFIKNGGHLTVFYVGEETYKAKFLEQFASLGNVAVINAAELNPDQMARILLTSH